MQKNYQNPEQKTLGALSLFFGISYLLISWIPLINLFFMFLAYIALLFGILGLLVNLKNRKRLAVSGTLVSILSLYLTGVFMEQYAEAMRAGSRPNVIVESPKEEPKITMTPREIEITNALNQLSYWESRSESEKQEILEIYKEQEEALKNFRWTKEGYNQLVLGNFQTGEGGTSLNEISLLYGEPPHFYDWEGTKPARKSVNYDVYANGNLKRVHLEFLQNEQGDWLLVGKNETGLE